MHGVSPQNLQLDLTQPTQANTTQSHGYEVRSPKTLLNEHYIWLICGSINFANLSTWNCLNFKVRSHIFSRCPLCKFRSSVLFRLEKHVEKRHQGIQVEGFIAEVYNKNKPIGPLTTHSKKPLTEHYTINSDGVSYEAFNKYRSNPNLFSSW